MGLPQQIIFDRGRPAITRVGTVVSVGPLQVEVQGTVFDEVGVLNGYTPLVGDTVILLGQSAVTARGASWIALGRPGTDSTPAPLVIELTSGTELNEVPNAVKYWVECIGGGGGGGGCAGAAAGQSAAAGGGGGGGYSGKWYLASELSFPVSYVIGSGGAGGTPGNNNGSTGTATTFEGQTANPGTGGEGSAASSTNTSKDGGNGGTGTGGDINVTGNYGGGATTILGGSYGMLSLGGGAAVYGTWTQAGAADQGNIGVDADPYGNGGSGAFERAAGATNRRGGNGSDGRIIVTAYFD